MSRPHPAQSTAERFVTTSDGVRLHVIDEGRGRPMLMIGGYGSPAAGWLSQRSALHDEHRIVTLDRRSHGLSDKPAFGHRMSRHGKDVADVMDELALDDVLLVGASMGSSTVLAYCDLFGTSRLRGVVLVDQTPKMINEGDWELGFTGLKRQGLTAFVDGFPGDLNPFHTMPAPELLAPLVEGPAFSIDDTRDLLRDHAEKDWRDVLPRLDVPVWALAGRHSPVWPWESSAWMAEAAPHGELRVFEASGHAPMLEEPDAFNAVLSEAARA